MPKTFETIDQTGSAGGMLITSAQGAITNVRFGLVEILEDATTLTVWTNPTYKGAALTSRTWKRGDRVGGLTTAVTVSAGAVLAHNRV
jgi:hypothetical protein